MSEQKVMVSDYTRREFREAMAEAQFKAAIVATGATEQHLEHLAMGFDIATSTHVATEAARRLYPQVVVGAPMAVGISEHHMMHKGTMTAKPGSWLAVLFDAVESFVRHGIRNVLVLNGHGGNEAPMYGILRQWQLYFQAGDPEVNVQFHSYWNLSRELAEPHCTGRVPGHAQDYETSMALFLFPEMVRQDALGDQEDKLPLEATAEKGRLFVAAAVDRTAQYVQGMIDGKHRTILRHVYSKEMVPEIEW